MTPTRMLLFSRCINNIVRELIVLREAAKLVEHNIEDLKNIVNDKQLELFRDEP